MSGLTSRKSLPLFFAALILFVPNILSQCRDENLFEGAKPKIGNFNLNHNQIAYNCESEYICTNITQSTSYCGILNCINDNWSGDKLCQKNIRAVQEDIKCLDLPILENGIYVGDGCVPNTWSRSVCTYICDKGFRAASMKADLWQQEIGTIKCTEERWEIPKCEMISTTSSGETSMPVAARHTQDISASSKDNTGCTKEPPDLSSAEKIMIGNDQYAYTCKKGYVCTNPMIMSTEWSKFCGLYTCADGDWSHKVWCEETSEEPRTLNVQPQFTNTEKGSTQSFSVY